jgi:hypothetical protein
MKVPLHNEATPQQFSQTNLHVVAEWQWRGI